MRSCAEPPQASSGSLSPAVGATVGAVGGHLWKGLSRSDVKELGDLIDAGQAALLVIGESSLQRALEKAGLKAEKQIAKELDLSADEIDDAIQGATAASTNPCTAGKSPSHG